MAINLKDRYKLGITSFVERLPDNPGTYNCRVSVFDTKHELIPPDVELTTFDFIFEGDLSKVERMVNAKLLKVLDAAADAALHDVKQIVDTYTGS